VSSEWPVIPVVMGKSTCAGINESLFFHTYDQYYRQAMPKHAWIEYPLCALALLGPFVVIILRLTIRKQVRKLDGTVEMQPFGIGVRVIQLIAVLILVPTIAVLGFEGILTGEGIGTLMGAIVGYVLGGITAPVPNE